MKVNKSSATPGVIMIAIQAITMPSIEEVLKDRTIVTIRRNQDTSFKYLLHMVLAKPEVSDLPEGHNGWMPRRLPVIGIIAVRMDHNIGQILDQDISELTHKQWIAIFEGLALFDQALDRLGLSSELRTLAQWSSDRHRYYYRNVWLRGHWQWLRILEENPGLTTLTVSLADIVAATEADKIA